MSKLFCVRIVNEFYVVANNDDIAKNYVANCVRSEPNSHNENVDVTEISYHDRFITEEVLSYCPWFCVDEEEEIGLEENNILTIRELLEYWGDKSK